MKFSMQWKLAGRNRSGLQRVGKRTVLPSEFVARFEFPDDHTVELDIAVQEVQRDGTAHTVPACNGIRIERNPSLPPLTGTELRRVPVGSWVEFACQQAAMRPVDGQPGAWAPVDTDDEADAALEEIRDRTKRRRVTDELLQNVATHYEHNGDSAQAVADAFHVSLSQAHRYLKQARAKGLLQEVES